MIRVVAWTVLSLVLAGFFVLALRAGLIEIAFALLLTATLSALTAGDLLADHRRYRARLKQPPFTTDRAPEFPEQPKRPLR